MVIPSLAAMLFSTMIGISDIQRVQKTRLKAKTPSQTGRVFFYAKACYNLESNSKK